MVLCDDSDPVELGLEKQVDAASAYVARFHGVIAGEDALYPRQVYCGALQVKLTLSRIVPDPL